VELNLFNWIEFTNVVGSNGTFTNHRSRTNAPERFYGETGAVKVRNAEWRHLSRTLPMSCPRHGEVMRGFVSDTE